MSSKEGYRKATEENLYLVHPEGERVEVKMMEGGTLVGKATISYFGIPLLEIFYVFQEGVGYGSKFLNLLEENFKKRGYDCSVVDAIYPIVSWFAERDYEIIERDPPTYIMSKKLK